MTAPDHHHQPSNRSPLWLRIVRGVSVFAVRAAGTFVILSALFVLFAQTDLFRKWVRDIGMGLLDEQLQGKLVADDVRLDLFHGIEVVHPRLYADGTTVLDAERLTLNYDLSTLFVRVATITDVNIEKPTIQVIRSEKGAWNVERITKPSADTTSSEPPEGTLVVRRFIINNGSVLVDDRMQPWPAEHVRFDPLHQKLEELQLDLSARLNLREHDAAVAINGMSFKDGAGGPLTVTSLAAIVRCSKAGIDVQALRLNMLRTSLEARLAMDSVDVFAGFADSLFHTQPLVGHVETHAFYGPDLHYFVPEVDLLETYTLHADAVFTGNSIRVTNMELHGGSSVVHGNVFVNELEGRRPLEIDIAVVNSEASYADVRHRLRFVPLPDLPFLSRTRLDTAYVRGRPDDSLWIEVHAEDRPGRIDGVLTLLTRDPKLGYTVNATVARGDLSAFADSTITTALNGHVEMQGRGLTLQDLDAVATVRLEPSVILGRPVREFATVIRGDGNGRITIDTLHADLAPFQLDTTHLDQDDGSQTVDVSGTLDVADPARPIYNAQLETHGLDLARVLRTPGLPDRLSMALHVDAEGVDIDSLRGVIGGRVYEMALQDRSMMPFDLQASMTRRMRSRSLKLETDFARIDVTGEYEPSGLINAVMASTEAIAASVADAVKCLTSADAARPPHAVNVAPMHARFDVDIADASPINIGMRDALVSGAVMFGGELKTTASSVKLLIDTLEARHVSIVGDSLHVSIDPTNLSALIDVVNLDVQPHLSRARIHGHTDSVIAINDLLLKHTSIDLDHATEKRVFRARSGLNTMEFVAMGSYAINGTSLSLALDSAEFAMDTSKNLRWGLAQPARASISGGVTNIEDLVVQRPFREKVSVSGSFSSTGFKNAQAVVESFPLADLHLLMPLEATHPLRLVGGLVTRAEVKVDGPMAEPQISTEVQIDQLSYNQILLGSLDCALKHENRNITGLATVHDPSTVDTARSMVLRIGAFPFDAGFAQVERRIDENRPWDVQLNADELSLAVAEPFLPGIERVQGKADASIFVVGPRLSEVELTGNAKYWNASFLTSSTNVVYQSFGSVSLAGQTLSLDTISLFNTSRDLRGGRAQAKGKVFFDGLTVDSMDLIITTPTNTGIKVMNNASQARSPNVYGDLVIGSGKIPIRMYGKINSPRLTGDILVYKANLTMPQERSTVKAQSSRFERYIDDEVESSQSLVDYALYGRRVDTTRLDSTSMTARSSQAIKSAVTAASGSFADILDYNIKIYLKGSTLMTMILGTFEILTADLELKDPRDPLVFTGKLGDNSTNLRGIVRLKEGASTYKFYKPFATGGTLNFSAGSMTNPALDLTATYVDRRFLGNTSEEYKVQLRITGSKEKPKISYRLWRNEREATGDSAKIASDALMLILVGRTSDELVSSGQADVAGQVNAALSATLTKTLSEIVSDIGFIQSAQFDAGKDISDSRITIVGQLYPNVYYKVSGQVNDLSGNSTFTITIPLSVFTDTELTRQFLLDLSQTVNNSGNVTRQTRLWEVKLGWRLQ